MSSSLAVPASSSRTLAFYEANAAAYVARTADLDMSEAYRPLLSRMPDGARLLDAGCGSGRDSAAFRALGYNVVATEPCAALAQAAAERSGVDVFPFRHEQLPFSQAFDGIWACATLLHVERAHLRQTIRRFVTALAPGGFLFATFKAGEVDGCDEEGRWFTRMSRESLVDLFSSQASCTLVEVSESRDASRADTHWLGILVQRRPLVIPTVETENAPLALPY